MSMPTETAVRAAAPRVSEAGGTLALLREETKRLALRARRRTRLRWAAFSVAGAMALGGTGAALASTPGVQTALGRVWWDDPHSVNQEMTMSTRIPSSVDAISCIAAADYAAGVDPGDATAQKTFQAGQDWLAQHPLSIPVPADASRLTPQERARALATVPTTASSERERNDIPIEQATAVRLALQNKAFAAVGGDPAAVVHDRRAALTAQLGTYLSSLGDDPALLQISDHDGTLCGAVAR